MMNTIPRTGISELTDSELLLLDIAALDGGLRSFFLREIFPMQYNYPSHDLPDELLHETLDRFEQKGIITGEDCLNYDSQPDRRIRLTSTGGALWESERLPDWSRFVTDSYSDRYIKIYGHSASICEAFFEVARYTNLIQYRGGLVKKVSGHRRLVYWRDQQTIHCLAARIVCEENWPRWDYRYFEEDRCWWRFANEIGKFWSDKERSFPSQDNH